MPYFLSSFMFQNICLLPLGLNDFRDIVSLFGTLNDAEEKYKNYFFFLSAQNSFSLSLEFDNLIKVCIGIKLPAPSFLEICCTI